MKSELSLHDILQINLNKTMNKSNFVNGLHLPEC